MINERTSEDLTVNTNNEKANSNIREFYVRRDELIKMKELSTLVNIKRTNVNFHYLTQRVVIAL